MFGCYSQPHGDRSEKTNQARRLETDRFGASKVTNCSTSDPNKHVRQLCQHRTKHHDSRCEQDQSRSISMAQSGVMLLTRDYRSDGSNEENVPHTQCWTRVTNTGARAQYSHKDRFIIMNACWLGSVDYGRRSDLKAGKPAGREKNLVAGSNGRRPL